MNDNNNETISSSSTDVGVSILADEEQESNEVSTESNVRVAMGSNEAFRSEPLISFGTVQLLMNDTSVADSTNEVQDRGRNFDQPTAIYEYMPSPVNINIFLDSPIQLSNDTQLVNASTRISDDDIFLGIRETVGQPAESEVDNDFEIIAAESPATEPAENEHQHTTLNQTIQNIVNLNPIEIDLTMIDDESETTLYTNATSVTLIDLREDNGDEENATSSINPTPLLVIDLTEDDDDIERETVSTVDPVSPPVVDLTQDSSEEDNVSVVPAPSTEERLSTLPSSSTQSIDQQRSVTGETDNLSEQIKTFNRESSKRKKRAQSNIDNLSTRVLLSTSTTKRHRSSIP